MASLLLFQQIFRIQKKNRVNGATCKILCAITTELQLKLNLLCDSEYAQTSIR